MLVRESSGHRKDIVNIHVIHSKLRKMNQFGFLMRPKGSYLGGSHEATKKCIFFRCRWLCLHQMILLKYS